MISVSQLEVKMAYDDYEGRGQHRRPKEAPARIHAGRGPRGHHRPDERILEEINGRLTDDTDLDASDIIVSINGGVVTLSGSVDSLWDKRQAKDIAESVSGVTAVNNRLRVSMATQTTPIQTDRR
jgi:osmotically-inducible protein OsmY